MFQTLGNFVSRAWWVFLLIWAVSLTVVFLVTPDIDAVTKEGEFTFLPDDAPSRQGERLFQNAFPNDLLTSSIVIVLHRHDSPQGLLPEDRQFITDVLHPRLQELAQQPGTDIAEIRGVSDELIGRMLESGDGRAALTIVELKTEFLEYQNTETVTDVEEILDSLREDNLVPAGLQISLTGGAVVGRDINQAKIESADATEFWTITLLVILLTVVYRAPLLTLIPLITLYIGLTIAIRTLAWFAGAGYIELFKGIEVYTIVVAYGAGVDYTLFISSRFKEELDSGATSREAVANSIGRVGAAVTASAGTEIAGIAMMLFAAFGKFHQAGISIPSTLFVMLLGALTLTPSLLRFAGRWAFWPQTYASDDQSRRRWFTPTGWFARFLEERPLERIWERFGHVIRRKPWHIWLGGLAMMTPFAVVAVIYYNTVSYGLISQLSADAVSVEGTAVLQEHFPAGEVGPVTLLIKSDRVDFTEPSGIALIESLSDDLRRRSDELYIGDIRSVANPLGYTARTDQELAEGSTLEQLTRRAVMRRKAVEYYVSQADQYRGDVTWIDVVLTTDPFVRASIRHLDELEQAVRQALRERLGNDFTVYAIGSTASIRDLKTIANQDRVRINVLVTAAVLLILLLMLRKLVISVYLILSVLLSFLTTLGVTYLVFWALDPEGFVGLDWTVPLFLFTILVAVGIDYNIFLVSRVDEEQDREGPIQGIVTALTKTGRIISSCGIIMAGTFSSLMIGGELARMTQLGFALAFGLLLDTFVVRPMLVPSFLILLHSGRLGFLGRLAGTKPAPERERVAS